VAIRWTVTLTCEDCGAAVRYEDERPSWRIIEPDLGLIREAEEWLREYPGMAGSALSVSPRTAPPYVRRRAFHAELAVPETRRYVVCPACDGRAFPASAGEDEEAAVDTLRA
jgi:hypothetical protein